ncbi:serine/threonine-protein kinase [Nannocystis radixulma]|uniref:Protein kinase n=1 Tax=Nannocystis radixulma TaxID=2995305 RepID=A0ABT5BK23_9BACT|nr:serine/threonine-protein kinase [Nannocystis radixulma]MDC0674501.1 protein kinase [Nannocystis radixulma]
MKPGEVVGDRFILEYHAGTGGMAEVYRAADRATGDAVAVKMLAQRRGAERARFEREAEVLAELRHPAIVRYVARGLVPSGEPYLVMEWLEGEDLAHRLERSPLSVIECITLGARTADALGAAHARGVIHRDLKPSNLFLVGRQVERAKVLDFGIARFDARTHLTQAGAVLGTPGYMAPEQARGEQDVTPRVDVFSLGCVLFECLAGSPAFTGDHLMAVLAKVLFAEVPRLRQLRPEVPRSLEQLLAQMLAKRPEERPRDGAEVAAALSALGGLPEPPRERPMSLTDGERQVLSVVLMGGEHGIDVATTQLPGDELAEPTTEELRGAVAIRGGHFERLADGSIVTTIVGGQIATDQAVLAARCALAMQTLSPGRPVAIATGQGEVAGPLPVGDAIDRAVRMLAARPGPYEAPLPIALDDVTAGLLDARFDVREGPLGLELVAEAELAEGTRTLLGKATSCVGRERELATLEGIFSQCVDDSVAHAVLVTAPAGLGKSRLAHEVVRALRERGEPLEIWCCRGDSLRAGSAFDLLGQLLRDACRMRDGEPLAVRQDKLHERVARSVSAGERRRVTEFLGEIIQLRLPDEESAPLRAARQDVQLMSEQMRRAWEEFVLAETAAHPVLLVLEDLHWGDLPTVQFIDAALRSLAQRPLMVLALARPEVHTLFPKLWEGRDVQHLRLKGLPQRASERLIRQVLGAAVSTATVERLVVQAEGNAFYLEELIRAVAERRGEALPQTVLAMVQARLTGLHPDVRRVLRAASVFGEVFWLGGVAALLGGVSQAADAAAHIADLVRAEVLVRRADSRFPAEQEFAFRHALLREGAYAMLTGADRALGHRLAGAWLAESGENNPIALAEHFERGGDPVRAGSYYIGAAEHALRGNDTTSAVTYAHQGLKCDVPNDGRVALLIVLCEAHGWRSELDTAASYAREAVQWAAPGTAPWARAIWALLWEGVRVEAFDEFDRTLDLVRAVTPAPEATAMVAWALATGMFILDIGGQFQRAEVCLRRVHAIVEPVAGRDPFARGVMELSHVHREAMANEDPWAGLQWSQASRRSFLEASHRRHAAIAQLFVGVNYLLLGAFAEAEHELRELMREGVELGSTTSMQNYFFVCVLANRGALEEARQEAARMVEFWQGPGLTMDQGRVRLALADVHLRLGALDDATREVRAAIEQLRAAPIERASATAILAAIELAQGRAAAAAVTARAAVAQFESLGSFGLKGAHARLVHARALHAAGDHDAARDVIRAARDRLLANAAKITDPIARRRFLERVAENAGTLELARAWLGEDCSECHDRGIAHS